MLAPELNMLMDCVFFFTYCFVVWNSHICLKHVSDLQLLPCYPSLQFRCFLCSPLRFCLEFNTSCHSIQFIKAVYGQDGVSEKILQSFCHYKNLKYVKYFELYSSQHIILSKEFYAFDFKSFYVLAVVTLLSVLPG